ncbi:MAG: hypothetical protein IPP71_07600 [Bacteroidetes bacterium]|nr:hypothetical protein [Bacteroidota bacterium]
MKKIVVLFFLISGPLLAQNVLINVTELPVAASLRGLSVVDDKIFWVGGTMGTICKSATGGKSFECMKVLGNEDADFRSVFAFDIRKAIIANVGTPAKIFLRKMAARPGYKCM